MYLGTGGGLAHFWFVAHLLVFYLLYVGLDAVGCFRSDFVAGRSGGFGWLATLSWRTL